MLIDVAVDRHMQYFYYFANTSLVLRLLTYLSAHGSAHSSAHGAIALDAVTVIYLVDRWVVRIKVKEVLPIQKDLDFISFLNENGSPYSLNTRIKNVIDSLESGTTITDVMHRYHVVVVSHGALRPADIEDFKDTFVRGLGYCPPSLV
ncbi:MAG: hypothetical protein AAFR58_20100 [Cyanobacteria bacterium J06627_28]